MDSPSHETYESREDATVFTAVHRESGKNATCGWLVKLGDPGKWNASWKRRFFVLVDSDFIYYEDAKQAKRKGSIDISTVTELKPYTSAHSSRHTWPPNVTRFEVITPERTWILSSGDSESDKHIWLQALADAVPAKRKERRELAIFSAAPEISEDSGIGGSSKAQGSAGLGSVVEFEKKEGWLWTRRAVGGWKRRFVVLRGSSMVVYRDSSLTIVKSELNLAGGSVEPLELNSSQGSANSPVSAVRLATPEKSDWGAESTSAGTEWLEAFQRAVVAPSTSGDGVQGEGGSGTAGSMVVSCDIFEEHPIFGFSQCRQCAVAKSQHFDVQKLALNAGSSTIGTAFEIPKLEVHREGWLFVRKKAQRFGEWKKRYAYLDGLLLSLCSAPRKSAKDTFAGSANVQRFPINVGCRLVRYQRANDGGSASSGGDANFRDPSGSDLGLPSSHNSSSSGGSSSSDNKDTKGGSPAAENEEAGGGRWEFSVESDSDSILMSAASEADRDGWVSDVSAALTHCHAVAAARLADVSTAAQSAKEAAEKGDKGDDAEDTGREDNGSNDQKEAGDKEHQRTHTFVLHARANALAEELAVLTARRQKTRDYITIHEDVARSAAKHYQKLAKKLSRADQAFVARFLDKGSLEMLGAKLHVLLSDTAPPFDLQGALADSASIGAAASPSAGNASNEAEDTLSDAALTCLALTNCFLAAATSFLGHHYLASHQRASLHAFARGVFLDAKAHPPSRVNGSSGSGGPQYLRYPLLWNNCLDALVEVLLALAQFSGDGRNAVLEVLSAVAFRYPDGLDDPDGSNEDPDGSIKADGLLKDGDDDSQRKSVSKGNDTELHSGSVKSAAAMTKAVMEENGVGAGSVAAFLLTQQQQPPLADSPLHQNQQQRHQLKVLASPFGGFVAALAAATAQDDASSPASSSDDASTTAAGGAAATSDQKESNPAEPTTSSSAQRAALHPLGVPASTLAEVVDLVTAMVFPDALASPPPLNQRMAIATALRLAGFDQLLHQWQSAAIVQLRAHAKREALNAAAVAAAKKQEEAQVELATLLNRGRALSKEEAERVQVLMKEHGAQAPLADSAPKTTLPLPPGAQPPHDDKNKGFKLGSFFGKRASSSAAAPLPPINEANQHQESQQRASTNSSNRSSSAEPDSSSSSSLLPSDPASAASLPSSTSADSDANTTGGQEAAWKASRNTRRSSGESGNGDLNGANAGKRHSQVPHRNSLNRDASLGDLVKSNQGIESKRKLTLVDEIAPAVAEPAPTKASSVKSLFFGSSSSSSNSSSATQHTNTTRGRSGTGAGDGNATSSSSGAGNGGTSDGGNGGSRALLVSDVASWSLLTERIDLFFQLCLEDEDEEAEELNERRSAHALLSRTIRHVLPPPATFANAVAVWPADLSIATTKLMTVSGQAGHLEPTTSNGGSGAATNRSRAPTFGGKVIEAPSHGLLPPVAAQATVSDWFAQGYGVAEGPGAGLRSELLELLENCANALQAADDAAIAAATVKHSESSEGKEASVDDESSSEDDGSEEQAEEESAKAASSGDTNEAGTEAAAADDGSASDSESVAVAPEGLVKKGKKGAKKISKAGKSPVDSPAPAHVVPSLASFLRREVGNSKALEPDKSKEGEDDGKTTALEAELKVLKQELSALQATQAAKMAAVADSLLEQATLLSAAPKRVVTLAEDPAFAKFFKMLALHIPKAAVVMKMSAEGVDPGYLERDPSSPSPNQSEELLASLPPLPPPEASSAPTAVKAKDDPMYAKYFKMLSMHIPMGAVTMKMQADGLNPDILERGPDAPSPNQNVVVPEPAVPDLMLKDDPIYARFFKMLKMHLPRGAVEQKMRAEGMDPSVLDLPLDGPSPSLDDGANKADPGKEENVSSRLAASEAKAKGVVETEAAAKLEQSKKANAKARAVYMGPRPTRPIKAVYVDKVPDAHVDNCLFGGIYDVLHDSTRIGQFTSSLEAGFAARTDRRNNAYPTQRPNAKMGAEDAKKEKIKELTVIEPRRAQNLSIAIKKMGRVLTVNEVATAILVADLNVLTEEKVDLLQLLELEPDEDAGLRQAASANQRARVAEQEKHRQEEEEAMRASESTEGATASSDASSMPTPAALRTSTVPKFRALEAYLLGLQSVPRLNQKLQALAMRRSADQALGAAAGDVRTIAAALVEVRQSNALVELLRLSLHVANFMNAGSARQTRAIQLKTLGKFATVKGLGAASTAKAGAAAAAAPLSNGNAKDDDSNNTNDAGDDSSSSCDRGSKSGGSGGSILDRFTFSSLTKSMKKDDPHNSTHSSSSSQDEVVCPAYTSKSLMHFVAHVSVTLAPNCLALSSELSSLERAAAIDLGGLDGGLRDITSRLRVAKKEVDQWCKDADDARAAAASSSGGSGDGGGDGSSTASPEYALKMGVPEGVLELRAALARADQARVSVGDSRRGVSQLATDAMTWLGEKSATTTTGAAETASSVQDFLATALGVSRAFSAAVADNAVAAEAESRRLKKLAAEAEAKRLKEEARARVLAAEAAARAALEPPVEDDEEDAAGHADGDGSGVGAGGEHSASDNLRASTAFGAPTNRWKSSGAAGALGGKLKRSGNSRASMSASGARGGARSGRKDAFAGGGGLFSALSSMRSNMTGKGSGPKEESESSDDGGDDMWKSSDSEED